MRFTDVNLKKIITEQLQESSSSPDSCQPFKTIFSLHEPHCPPLKTGHENVLLLTHKGSG